MLSLVVLLLFGQAWGQGVEVSAQGGVAYPSYSGTSLRSALSGNARYFFKNGLGVGGFVFSSLKEEDTGDFYYVLNGLDLSYKSDGIIKNSRLGLRASLAEVKWQTQGYTLNFTPFAWGMYYSQNWELTSWFYYGFEVGLLSVNGDSQTRPPNLNFELKSFDSFHALLQITVAI